MQQIVRMQKSNSEVEGQISNKNSDILHPISNVGLNKIQVYENEPKKGTKNFANKKANESGGAAPRRGLKAPPKKGTVKDNKKISLHLRYK